MLAHAPAVAGYAAGYGTGWNGPAGFVTGLLQVGYRLA